MPSNATQHGFLRWLGRQVGFVRKAVDTDVTAPKVVYRAKEVQQSQHPDRPELTLRRTVTDEVIADAKKKIERTS